MKILIDTHALLWFFTNDGRLTAKAKGIYLDKSHSIYLSAASFWELNIKCSLGKLKLSSNWRFLLKKYLEENSIQWLNLSPEHCHQVSLLPFHHKDPFDRMLVAQALTENMPLITCDSEFSQYGIECIW